MEKLKLGVVIGGMSTENEVSVVSGKYVLKNLDKEKYEIFPIFIDKLGVWHEYKGQYDDLKMGEQPKDILKISNVFDYIKKMDVIFPVLHGLYGEDGTIQGMFELLKKPYVGCKVLGSSVGMDKVYTKIIFEKARINQTKSCYIRKNNDEYIFVNDDFSEEKLELMEICNRIEDKLKYPIFIKPSNSGSSVGVTKTENITELKEAIKEAGKYDCKILAEQGIDGKEVECAVLGNEDVIAGEVGEIRAADEFYSFDAKYNNEASKTVIPADITPEQKEEIRKLAVKAFKAIDGKGLSRVDFFVENASGKIYLNEINTMPGFTPISMYPKLMDAYGIPYSELLDRLIKLALE